MANSLQDQLLKAGLIDKKNALKAKKQKHRQKVSSNEQSEAELAKQRAEQQKAEKAARDRALNEERNNAAKQKALASQIRQLIDLNKIPQTSVDDGTAYNFTHATKIKRIYISAEHVEQLSRGQLAIASLDDRYHLIPASVAEKIQQRDEQVIIVRNEDQSEEDENDPYADYKIPDDLMW